MPRLVTAQAPNAVRRDKSRWLERRLHPNRSELGVYLAYEYQELLETTYLSLVSLDSLFGRGIQVGQCHHNHLLYPAPRNMPP